MQVIEYARFGDVDVLTAAQRPTPTVAAGQVRIEVTLAGVNPVDGKIRAGAMREQMPVELPLVPGSEAVGVVTEVGAGVALAVGDRVVGWTTGGGYGEQAVLRVFVPVPGEIPDEVAVAMPVAGEAASRALGALHPVAGETLLVHGAAGSVGRIAAQLALSWGVRVVGTAAVAGHDDLRSLGVHPTTYGDGLVRRVQELAPDGIDAVLDAAGRGVLPAAIELRGGTDRVVTLADPAAFGLGVPFLAGGPEDQTTQVLEELLAQVLAGRVRMPPARILALADAAEAQRLSDLGQGRGKIALAPRLR